MEIWHRVYQELYEARVNSDYIAIYMRQAKKATGWYKGIVIGLSAIGSISWTVNPDFSIAACMLLFAIQLLEKLEAFIVLDNEKIQRIGDYRLQYCDIFTRYDKLLMMMADNVITDDEARDRYFKIRKKALLIEQFDNTVKIEEKKKLFAMAETKAKDYMDQHFKQESNGKEQ